jgi:hypothetical protein
MVGTVTIQHENPTASGGQFGAGIGIGQINLGRGRNATVVTVKIQNGNVTASSAESGAGIGTGSIWIRTATVELLCLSGAAILICTTAAAAALYYSIIARSAHL